MNLAADGNLTAIREICDRIDGKATHPVAGDKDNPLVDVTAIKEGSLAKKLARLAQSRRRATPLVAGLTDDEAAALFYDWQAWARPSQRIPLGDWDGWLILAGRGFGKTRTGAETVCAEAQSGRAKRIGLVAETSADGRDVLVNGESGILACSPPWFRPVFSRSDGRPKLTWPNGAIATLHAARVPDQLRGPQRDFIGFDELAEVPLCARRVRPGDVWGCGWGEPALAGHDDAAQHRLRSCALVARDGDGVVETRGASDENLNNLSPSYRRNGIDRYRDTRLGRQEFTAELLESNT